MTNSCFAVRLSHFLELTDAEEKTLARLEENRRHFKRGEIIREQDSPADELFILNGGWAFSYIRLGDHKRQILRLEFPGDLMGTSSIAFGHASDTLVAVTDCVLCPLDRIAVRALFDEHSRLGTLLFLISQEDIGDATGLTSVHVNRMMQELSRDGLISRNRHEVTILDEEKLVKLAEYVNRYATIDTSWLKGS